MQMLITSIAIICTSVFPPVERINDITMNIDDFILFNVVVVELTIHRCIKLINLVTHTHTQKQEIGTQKNIRLYSHLYEEKTLMGKWEKNAGQLKKCGANALFDLYLYILLPLVCVSQYDDTIERCST